MARTERSARLHLLCPRCGLTITPKAQWLTIEHCPRCIASAHIPIPLFASTPHGEDLYGENPRPGIDRRRVRGADA